MLIEDVNEEAPAGGALATAGMKPLLRRLIMVGAALASVAVLVGAILLVLRLAQPPDYPLSGRNPDGEIVGRLAQVESGVVLVQPDTPGSSLVPLLLSKGTRVRIGSQEGWVGDLRPGGPVRVSYELYEGKRLAQTVEVPETAAARPAEGPAKPAPPGKASEAMPSQAAVPPLTLPSPQRGEGVAAAAPAQPAAAVPLSVPAPTQAAPPKPVAVAVPQPRPVAAPASSVAPLTLPSPQRGEGVAVAAPAPLPRPAAPAPIVTETRRPARPAPATAVAPPPPPPAREPARSRDADSSTDGSAAVDWLLNNRR